MHTQTYNYSYTYIAPQCEGKDEDWYKMYNEEEFSWEIWL
jgi:hypothetical protein